MAKGNRTTKAVAAATVADATRPDDYEKEPRHVLLSPNLGGVFAVGMAAAEVKGAAELLALLHDEGTKADTSKEDQSRWCEQL